MSSGLEVATPTSNPLSPAANGTERVVNAVTGAWQRDTVDDELARMTDDEKEREAERLFVTFEKLNQSGVITAQNPLTTAQQSGRFENADEQAAEEQARRDEQDELEAMEELRQYKARKALKTSS